MLTKARQGTPELDGHWTHKSNNIAEIVSHSNPLDDSLSSCVEVLHKTFLIALPHA